MTDAIESVSAPGAPPPGGHYSPAVRHGGLIYVSGQLGIRPDGSHTSGLSFEAQARQALQNLFALLAAAGSSPDRILRITAYIVGVENWPAFNGVYADMMGAARPARSVVPTPQLHHGYLVEIDAIAAEASPVDRT